MNQRFQVAYSDLGDWLGQDVGRQSHHDFVLGNELETVLIHLYTAM